MDRSNAEGDLVEESKSPRGVGYGEGSEQGARPLTGNFFIIRFQNGAL